MPPARRRPARLLSALALVLASLLATVSTAAPAEARTPAGRYANQAHKATNEARVAQALPALGKQRCVRRWAVKQAKAMAAATEMYHQDLAPLLLDCGLSLVGENVAYGYASGASVVNDGWMKSLGHRLNILNPAFTFMGIGARKGSDGHWYVAQVFGRAA